jgi:hypothetical protein
MRGDAGCVVPPGTVSLVVLSLVGGSCLTTRRILLQAALFALPQGCATAPPPPPPARVKAPAAPARAQVRIAVLPPDMLLFSDVAAALGDRLAHAEVSGTGPLVMEKVSMEVAQLSLECVSPTDDCFAKVGKYLQVDRLLWGQIDHDGDSAGVKVTVVFLDVGEAVSVGRAERTFPEPAAAILGLKELVDLATRRHPAPAAAAVSQSEAPP